MPVPLRLNYQNNSTEENSTAIDYSFLCDQLQSTSKSKMVIASNKDASLIMEIWSNGQKNTDQDSFQLTEDLKVTKRDIARLSARGFITKCEDGSLKLTSRGRTIVTTMALSEPNRFQEKRQQKSYNEILASMSKKDKLGYRMPKFATNQFNNLRLS